MRRSTGFHGNVKLGRLVLQLDGIQEESQEDNDEGRNSSSSSTSLSLSSSVFRLQAEPNDEFSCDFGDFVEDLIKESDQTKGNLQLALERVSQLDTSAPPFSADSNQDDGIEHARRHTANHGFSWKRTKSVESGWESDLDDCANLAGLVIDPHVSRDDSLSSSSSSSQSLEHPLPRRDHMLLEPTASKTHSDDVDQDQARRESEDKNTCLWRSNKEKEEDTEGKRKQKKEKKKKEKKKKEKSRKEHKHRKTDSSI